MRYARDAAQWSTGLQNLEFSKNALNSPDVALFDFTSVYASRNASRAKRVHTTCCGGRHSTQTGPQPTPTPRPKHVLMQLTGDSLLEPFWPTGSGAGRGFLSALDAAYTCAQWASKVVKNEYNLDAMIDVIAERESIYRLLAQTTPENVRKEFSLAPKHRYMNYSENSILEIKQQIKHLIGFQSSNQMTPTKHSTNQSAKRARRATVAVTSRDLSQIKDFSSGTTVEDDENDDRRRHETTLERQVSDDRHDDTSQTRLKSKAIEQKAEWLLGNTGTYCPPPVTTDERSGIHGDQDLSAVEERKPLRERRVKKEAILERAQQLETILSERKGFEPKLSRVGRIEENDWNFRVWDKSSKFSNYKDLCDYRDCDKCFQCLEPLNESQNQSLDKKSRVLENSRQILASRKTQIEDKMAAKDGKGVTPRDQHLPSGRDARKGKEWIERLSKELNEKMEKSVKKEEKPEVITGKVDATGREGKSCNECVRCGQEVIAMERISVSGDVLHRYL